MKYAFYFFIREILGQGTRRASRGGFNIFIKKISFSAWIFSLVFFPFLFFDILLFDVLLSLNMCMSISYM